MGTRVVLIAGIMLALVAPVPGSVAAGDERMVTIRVVVGGRLMGQKATLRIYDGVVEKTISVGSSRMVRVHAGRTTIVPSPIMARRPSTATIQGFRADNGTVVRFRYRRDTTSLPGPMTALATRPDGKPATGWDWVQSPDGTRVAFVSRDRSLLPPDEDSGLFVRDLGTGDVTEAAVDADGGPAWSPDSRRIAFVSNATLTPADGNGDPDVYVVDLATDDLELASVLSDGSGFHAAAAGVWQDDDHLVFPACTAARHYLDQFCGIHLRNLATGTTREIVPAGFGVSRWHLSPDGRRLLFESASDPLELGIDRQALYVTNLASGLTTVLSTNRKGTSANGPAWGAVWSPDSEMVAFRSTADNLVPGDTNGSSDPLSGTDVFIKDLRSREVSRVSTTSSGEQMTGEPAREEPAVQWAPNGKVVAFRFATATLTGDRRSTHSAVFVKRLSSGKLQPLIPGRGKIPRSPIVESYVFSPSGRRISFLFGPRNGCWTDVVPFANLNCHNVLVRDLRTHRLANVSTLDSGLGWLAGPQDRHAGTRSPVWLTENRLLFLAPDAVNTGSGAVFPVIKSVRWSQRMTQPPPGWTPPWCNPYRYWWSC